MLNVILVILGIIVVIAGVAMISVYLLRLVRTEIKLSQDQFLQLAKQQFSAEQTKSTAELELRKQAIDTSLQGLKDELVRYQNLIRELEKDRDKKYGNLETELKNASQATVKLQETTNHLSNILGNVKLRGQWGERMAEDIIRYAGLIEGVNFIKQKKLDQAATKPDFTFLLPHNYKVNMDVKFPLDNYVRMVNAVDTSEKDFSQKEFTKNVKDRIKEIQNRDYINPSEKTLDFVLLFIPNEQVYGFIQENNPDIMDTALSQKVVLCSPFTLYSMLCIIRQAHENFRYEQNIKEIIMLIDQFAKIYERFKLRFDDIGKGIEKLASVYGDLKDKSVKQLDSKISHIDGLKKGQRSVLGKPPDVIELTPQDSLEDESVQ